MTIVFSQQEIEAAVEKLAAEQLPHKKLGPVEIKVRLDEAGNVKTITAEVGETE